MTNRKSNFPIPKQGNKKQWAGYCFVDKSNIHGYMSVKNVILSALQGFYLVFQFACKYLKHIQLSPVL